MSVIDEKINSLSPDELDILNSDPQMLSDFKAKYSTDSNSQDTNSFVNNMKEVGKQAVQAALPSPDFNKPIQPENQVNGLSQVPQAAVEAAGQTLRDPTRISSTMSEPGDVAGDKVSNIIGGLTGKATGFATKVALDPQSYLGAAKVPATSIGETVEKGLPKLFKWLGNVPENATKIAEGKKFNLPSVTPEEVEQGVKNVQQALLDAKNEIGSKLNAAKADIGLPITPAEKEASIKKFGNAFGLSNKEGALNPGDEIPISSKIYDLPEQKIKYIGPMMNDSPEALRKMGMSESAIKEVTQPMYNISKGLEGHPANSSLTETTLKNLGYEIPEQTNKYVKQFSSPENLINAIGDFRQDAPKMGSKLRGKIASYLQDQINNHVNFEKGGDQIQGILKQQYGDLSHIITQSSPGLTAAKGKMADVLNVFDDLENKLADKDKSGKAEKFLRNMFVAGDKNPAAKDYLNKLAQLEVLSGKPVVTQLFDKLTGESFGKLIGRPTGAHVAEMFGVGDLVSGNVPGMLKAAAYLGAQAPKVLAGAAKAGYKVGNKATQTGLVTAMKGVREGFPLPDDSRSALQSVRDRLSNQ